MGLAIQAFLKGLSTLTNSKRIWIFQYVMNFLFALLIAYPFSRLLKSTVGKSLSVEHALSGFNYTLLNDFLQNYGLGLDAIRSQGLIVFLAFFLLLVFFNAGIVHVVQRYPGSYRFREFFSGGIEYFWRFFRLSLYFLLAYLFLAFVGFKIITLGGVSPFELENELGLISRSKIVLIVLAIVFVLLRMIQDVIKIMITKSREPIIFKPIFSGFSFFKRHFLSSLVLAVLHLILSVVFIGAYILAQKSFGNGGGIFFLVFFMGQLFALVRIALRIWRLSSVYQLVLRA